MGFQQHITHTRTKYNNKHVPSILKSHFSQHPTNLKHRKGSTSPRRVVHELDQTLRDPGVQHHLDIMIGTVRDVGETPPGDGENHRRAWDFTTINGDFVWRFFFGE